MTSPKNLVDEMAAKGPLVDAGNCNAGKAATDELLAEIKAGLRGVTPGPWYLKPASYGWDVWGNLDDGSDAWIGPVKRVISPHSRVHAGVDIEVDRVECEANARFIAGARNSIAGVIARLDAAEAENARLREALESLTEAPALSGVRDMVAGWNGENLPDGKRYTERHPSRLGAQIKTNCGRIYDLDERITSARAALEKAP